tara:strand:- start:4001 stop:4309 length:309 start_codon:yes stop_codon:yes gene_type:complete
MKKIENLKYIQYVTNFNIVSSTLQKWIKLKPNKEVDQMLGALAEIAGYVNNLESNESMRNKIISQYRADKIRAINRAQRAEEKIEELEKQVAAYKTKQKLGL